MTEDEMLIMIRDLYRMATWGAKNHSLAERARELLKQKNIKLWDDAAIELPSLGVAVVDAVQFVNTKKLSPVQAKARLLKGKAYAAAVRADPTLPVVRRHMRLDDYHADFLGGRNCARLTIPMVNVDQIRAAGSLLRQLGNEMLQVADEGGPTLGKVLAARGLCQTINRKLKGGVDYKGAR